MFKDYKKEDVSKSILFFGGEFCPSCKVFKKRLEDITVDIFYVDVEKNNDLARKYCIMSIPQLLVLDNNRDIVYNCNAMNFDKKEFLKSLN